MAENPNARGPRTADVWAVQCDSCFKWRVIPTQEEYEEIRSKFGEDPFQCCKKPNASCHDPGGDIEFDSTRIWLIDRPNIPKSPLGFKREVFLRSNYTKIDVYYRPPIGKKLRSAPQIAYFLSAKPEYKHLSVSDFSFARPKILANFFPKNAASEEAATPTPSTPDSPGMSVSLLTD